MIPRSYLFVPGDRPERFPKGLASGADVVMLDLEDGVAAADKDQAREKVAAWLSSAHPVYVRMNSVRSVWFAADAALLRLPGVAGVVLPKADSPEDIALVRAYMHDATPLVAMIESAVAVLNCPAIAAASGVARLAFGTFDLQLDTGISGDADELLYARSLCVLASRAAGIMPPIDGVVTALDDMAPVAASVARGRSLGFRAKLCIHPRQVPIVNAGFGPTPAEVAWAHKILDAVASATVGAIRVDGEMVDRPVIDRARAIIESAGE